MKNIWTYTFAFGLFAICFGGPLNQFTYRTQSIIFAAGIVIFLVIVHPKTQEIASAIPSSMAGDVLDNMFGDLMDFVQPEEDQEVVPTPVKQPVTGQKVKVAPPKVKKQPNTSAKLGYYEKEAMTIGEQLQGTYQIPVKIKPEEIIKSWNYVTYPLTPLKAGVKLANLVKVETDLARDISALHRIKYGDNGRVEVMTIDAHPKTLLQVTRANPQPLTWAERNPMTRPLTTCFGFYQEGVDPTPATIDIGGEDSDYINGGFFGQPGSGKTNTLINALDQLLEVTSPSMINVYGIDMKKNVFNRYDQVPHFRQFTSDPDQAINILDQFVIWCHNKTAPTDRKYRLLIIDEFQMLITHSEHGEAALQKITKIMQTGREFGIRVWLATQNPNADNYPTGLKPLTHFKVCGYIQNDDYVRRQLDIYGANKITQKRELIFVDAASTIHRTTNFWVTQAEREEMRLRLATKWQPYGDPMEIEREELKPDPKQVQFPITERRPLSPVEKRAVRYLKQEGWSLNAISDHVYGSKDKFKLQWIKEAIDEQE